MSGRKFRKPLQTQNNDPVVQQKMEKIIELKKGIKILKERMDTSKKDMIEYFEKNPQFKNSKYVIDDYTIHYLNKKTTDGITQKLIVSGLAQYFKAKGIADIGTEISQVMNIIKNQRQSKITPTIDIRGKNEPAKIHDV